MYLVWFRCVDCRLCEAMRMQLGSGLVSIDKFPMLQLTVIIKLWILYYFMLNYLLFILSLGRMTNNNLFYGLLYRSKNSLKSRIQKLRIICYK